MIINKLRIEEEKHIEPGFQNFPLAPVDLHLDSSAGANGYILKDSTGLGPPTLVSIVEGFDVNGVPILNNQADNRVIVLKIGLNPQLGQSYGSLRDYWYKLISRGIVLKLMCDSTVIAQTIGSIAMVDPVHFSNKPEIQITIDCKEPEFVAPFPVEVPLSTLDTATPIINYSEGSAPTGLDIVLEVTANHSNFSISNHTRFMHAGDEDPTNTFVVTYNFLVGDFIALSTHPRHRRLILTRGPTQYDLAGFISSGAVWPRLESGPNALNWTFGSAWMNFSSVSYLPRYWGV